MYIVNIFKNIIFFIPFNCLKDLIKYCDAFFTTKLIFHCKKYNLILAWLDPKPSPIKILYVSTL